MIEPQITLITRISEKNTIKYTSSSVLSAVPFIADASRDGWVSSVVMNCSEQIKKS